MTFPAGPPGSPGRPSSPAGPRRRPPVPRHRIRLIIFAALALLLLLAIGLVIETALGPKPKPNLTPPTPVPVPTGSSPGTSATPAPPAGLTGPIQIIQGSQLVNGVYLGFPHTTQGAVSAAEEFMSQIGSTLDPDRAAAVLRLVADPSYPKGPEDFADGTTSERRDLGLPVTGRVPQAASVILDPVEYQVRAVTPGQVTVLLLASDIITLPTQGTQSRVGVYPLRMHWTEDDWKILTPDPKANYAKLSAVPGTPAAASLGWQVMTP